MSGALDSRAPVFDTAARLISTIPYRLTHRERTQVMPYAFAVPIQPGKTDAARQFVQQILGPRRQEWDDLQRRQGVTRESYFLQPSPEGDLLVLYGEGTWTPPAQFMDLEQNPIDRWLREQMQDVTGIDIMEFGGEPPEMLGEWRSP